MKNKFYQEKWFLESLFEELPIAVTITDTNFKIVYVNPYVSKIFGYEEKELIGKDPIIFNADPCSSQIQQDIYKSLKECGQWKNKIINKKKNGDLFIVDLDIKSCIDQHKHVIGYVGFQKDVTRYHIIDEDMKKLSEEISTFKRFVELSGVGVGWVDLNKNLKFVNNTLLYMLGEDNTDDAYGKSLAEYYSEEDFDKIMNEAFPAIHQNGSWSGELTILSKKGDVIPTQNNIFILKDIDGNDLFYANVIVDMRERDIAEEKLKASEKKNRAVLEHSPVCTKILDKDFNLQYISSAGIEQLKIKDISKLYGKPFPFSFYPEESKKKMIEGLTISKKTGNILTDVFLISDIEGNEIWYNATIMPINDEDGELEYILVISVNITEEKKHIEILRTYSEQLKKSNEELEEFAYIASHDLQEPLRVVSSYCQLLKEKRYGDFNEDEKKYIDYSIDSVLRMKILIKDLLDFSRVGTKDEPFEKIYLEDVIKESLDDYSMVIEENNASITVESDFPEIFSVRFRMKQLFSNLISNSLKFRSKEPPSINIGSCEEDNFWLFYIHDNGIGIDSKYYERVFGIFKRLYSREEYPGTGIGLALCKKIVEIHGGKIWIDSSKNDGTFVYFTLNKHIDFP